MVIKEFKGKYRFLSNFYSSAFQINDYEYKTVEHWFQSQKSIDIDEKNFIRDAKTPGIAKSLGNRCHLRDDWEQIKLTVMEQGVRAKFSQNPELKQKLLDTGNTRLEEGNKWGDTFWGINLRNKKGQNHLGKILVKIRTEMQEK